MKNAGTRTVKRIHPLAVCGLLLIALTGCQSATLGPRADHMTNQTNDHTDSRIQVRDANAKHTTRAQPGQRVHILLARYADPVARYADPVARYADPVARYADPVARRPDIEKRLELGAGDALGRQMFQRYATVVRARQRRQTAQLAEADTATTDATTSEQLAKRRPRNQSRLAWLDNLPDAAAR